MNGYLLRLGPPFAHMTASAGDGAWQVRARSARHVVDIEGDANGSRAHRLPVPVPAERRLVDGPAQHFTGRLRVSVRRGRRMIFRGESELAALERGDLSAQSV
jgi:transglutaminase-like putative cysteine protease